MLPGGLLGQLLGPGAGAGPGDLLQLEPELLRQPLPRLHRRRQLRLHRGQLRGEGRGDEREDAEGGGADVTHHQVLTVDTRDQSPLSKNSCILLYYVIVQ